MKHSERFLALVKDAKTRVKEINLDQFLDKKKAKDAFVLVDVREESEWTAGHASGAIYMGRGIIERDIEHNYPETDTPLICYCGGGFRSALVADNLQKMGYTNVISLDGGFRAWLEADLPIVKGELT
ncbi:MAG: rhodanese-like domain-containing protein [Verrucomicrobiota bacterium]|nr:rhodanese-like domain-containing protein [Verrucomicrobiota bacterium]